MKWKMFVRNMDPIIRILTFSQQQEKKTSLRSLFEPYYLIIRARNIMCKKKLYDTNCDY